MLFADKFGEESLTRENTAQTEFLPHMPTYLRNFIRWSSLVLWLCLGSCAVRSGTGQVEASAERGEQSWRAVAGADVMYVGERHDDPVDHRYELEIVRGLLKRKIKFAIGWEMFDTTQQPTIDAWASRAISLDGMLAETDFEKHWGIYSPVYKQILQMAGKGGVPNLALNAPPELPRKVARGEPLTAEERAMIPTGFTTTGQGYQNFVAMMGGHPGMKETDKRRFFKAQSVWEQTMATRILEFKARNPNILLVVLTGRGHVSGGYGIPFYVGQKASLKQFISECCGDHTNDPRRLRRPTGRFVPTVFQNPGSSFVRTVPRTGNQRPDLLRYLANRIANSSAPVV
jgi:uncharacterized iron-regulated protein